MSKIKLNENQIRLLTLTDQCKGDGWFYSPPAAGPTAAGLARRGLLESRRDHNKNLRIKVTKLGHETLAVYGITTEPSKPKRAHVFADYCVRDGGIWLREYNMRLAEFSPNTHSLQQRLATLFDKHHADKRKADANE